MCLLLALPLVFWLGVWEPERGKMVLRGHTDAVTCVAWSPDGESLLSGSFDNTARIWDADTGQEQLVLRGHANFIRDVVWSPDNTRVLTGSADGTLRIWDALTGKDLFSLDQGFPVRWVFWTPEGKRVAGCSYRIETDSEVRVWDAGSGQLELSFQVGPINDLAWSPDGQSLATSWQGEFDNPDAHDRKHISPARIDIWDLATGKQERSVQGDIGAYYVVHWAPRGKKLFCGDGDGFEVWDLSSTETEPAFQIPNEDYRAFAWSPDGEKLATSSVRWEQATLRLLCTVTIWDVQSGEQLQRIDAHRMPAHALAWRADGKRLATGSKRPPLFGPSPGIIKIWDLSDFKK